MTNASAVVYVRQSFDRTGEGLAVDRQEEDALQLVKLRGWNLAGVYRDNDITAKGSKERDGFNAVLDDIEQGRASVIVAWSWERLERNRRDGLRLIETCQARESTIALVRGSDIDMATPAGRLVADMLSAMARHEIEQKSDRQKRANLQRAAKGLPHPGAHRPFGFEDDGMAHRADEAEALRNAYSELLGGATLTGIAKRLNAAGLIAPQGRPWRHQTLRELLKNARNAGLRTHRREVIGTAAWEPVVPEHTWRAAVALLTDPNRNGKYTTATPGRHLLSGIARCGLCEAKIGGSRTRTGARTYRCRDHSHLSIGAEFLDLSAETFLIEHLGDTKSSAGSRLLGEGNEGSTELDEKARALRIRIQEVEAWIADPTAGNIAAIRAQLDTLGTDLAATEAEMLESQTAQHVRGGPFVKAFLSQAIRDLDTDQLRALLADEAESIKLHPIGRGKKVTPFNVRDVLKIKWRRPAAEEVSDKPLNAREPRRNVRAST